MLNIAHILAEELPPARLKRARTLSRGSNDSVHFPLPEGAHWEMNEIQLRNLSDRFTYLSELEERKSAI